MSADHVPPSSFRTVWMVSSRNQLQSLKQKALSLGTQVSHDFAQQLRTIQRALEFVPLEWGEVLTELTEVQLKICLGFHDHIVVNYGVNEEERIVFVRSIRVLNRHFLG